MTPPTKELKRLLEGLEGTKLSSLKASPFDNAFRVFTSTKETNGLVILGTNGNMTDAVKSNSEWLGERAANPNYCHVTSGNWGGSRMQPVIRSLPQLLNSIYPAKPFSFENTIVTNAFLLASDRVGDIRKNLIDSPFRSVNALGNASFRFFSEYTLSYAQPKLIFAYGNAESGSPESNPSAWRYLRHYCRMSKAAASIPVPPKGIEYKFGLFKINGDDVPVVGAPHIARFPIYPEVIRRGLEQLGVL